MPPVFLNTQAIFKQMGIEYTCTNTPYFLTEISSVGIHFILNEIVFCSGISYCPTVSPYNHFSETDTDFSSPNTVLIDESWLQEIEARMWLFCALRNSEFIFNNFPPELFPKHVMLGSLRKL